MLRRTVLCLAMLTALAAAGSAGAADKGKAAKDDAKEATPGPGTIKLAAVALPVVVKGRLINYVFVTVQLHLSPGVDGAAVRIKEPFFRDSLVRAGHRDPFTLATDYTKLDEGRMRAQVMSDALAIVGPGKVQSVEILKQVSQHHSDLPSPFTTQVKRPEIIP